MPTMKERADQYGLPTFTVDLEKDARLGVDPWAVFDEAAELPPMFYSPAGRGFFVAADYDTIKEVMQDPDLWTSENNIVFTTNELIVHVSPLSDDPPRHTELRKALIPIFSPRVFEVMVPRIREITEELIAPIRGRSECDFYKEFATQLPAKFFLEWLGLNKDDSERMFELAKRAIFDFGSQEERDAVEHEIAHLIAALYAERRLNPTGDLATQLVQMEVNGEPVDESTLLQIGSLAFIAGQETTASNLTYVMYWLATHPEERARLVREPELIPDALEELTRLLNTGGPVGRSAKRDGEFRGIPIEKGDRIYLSRVTADRRLYDDVQLDRRPNRHTAFGLGIHRCLGSHVARIEMTVALEEWLKAFPEFQLEPGWVPTHRYGSFMQQLMTLPLHIESKGTAS